jgi:uncharacterized protein YndB with AHSA1/START domain
MAAPPERVYDLISDVTRMGQWSPECVRCEWLDGATGPEVGARFKARNKRGLLRWSNSPTVVAADRGREFAFSRKTPGAGEYVWRYQMAPTPDGGTDVTESYESVRPESRAVSSFVSLFTPGDEASHLQTGMMTTLNRIKQAAESDGRS